MRPNQRLKHLLAAGILTGLVLATVIALAWRDTSRAGANAMQTGATPTMSSPESTDTWRTENEQLRQAVETMRVREQAYQTQLELAVALAGFHAFVLLFDSYYIYRLSDLLLPFVSPYRPLWVGLGIIGFYLALLTSASFSWRQWLGAKRWRALHSLTFVAYALVTVHGLTAGTDSPNPGMKAVYMGSSLLVSFLTMYRLLTASKRRS